MSSCPRTACFLFFVGSLFHWEPTAAVKVIDTFGDGSVSYGNGRSNDIAVVAEDPKANLPNQFTICASLKSKKGPNILSFFAILDDQGSPLLSLLLFNFERSTRQRMILSGTMEDAGAVTEIDIVPMHRYWVHACLAFDATTGHAVVVSNGKAIIDTTMNPSKLVGTSLANNLFFGNFFFGTWHPGS